MDCSYVGRFKCSAATYRGKRHVLLEGLGDGGGSLRGVTGQHLHFIHHHPYSMHQQMLTSSVSCDCHKVVRLVTSLMVLELSQVPASRVFWLMHWCYPDGLGTSHRFPASNASAAQLILIDADTVNAVANLGVIRHWQYSCKPNTAAKECTGM